MATAKTHHSGCNPAANPAATTVRIRPVGDDLQYRSESAESGRSQPRMPAVR
ncbi:hypothetical protein [Streptomyces sp. NPDC092370]|uniref:hypothetical protein n=1 Tax=Streptomyces sp. NPDC092370 TaxID=3366016 RepID=UPI00381B657E